MGRLRFHRKAVILSGVVLIVVATVTATLLTLISGLRPGDLNMSKPESKSRIDDIFAIDSPVEFDIIAARHSAALSIDDYFETVEVQYCAEEYDKLKRMLALEKWESPREGRHSLLILSDSLCRRAYHFNAFTFWLDDSTRGLSVEFIHE